MLAVAILVLINPHDAIADDEDGELPFDEISVFLNVQGIGGTELPALIKGQAVYLSVTDIFNFLKIRNTSNSDNETISGFFIDQQANYLIDNLHNLIEYQEKIFPLSKDDIIRVQDNLYLKSGVFGKIFGLNCTFNFRNLSVDLNTKLELPLIRELRQESMRQNVRSLKGELKADSLINRDHPAFHLGMADWSVTNATETLTGQDTRLNLNLGAIIAGGETNISLNYSSREPFEERQQYYLWRYADNENKFLKQTSVGKIFSQSTSSIFAPIVGFQLSNTPTTYRRSFGTYNLSNRTEPGWMVELYVNNVLVDYKKADPSGFYAFEVPLVYGNSEVKLRFYGPFGEERFSQQNISIPFNFLPEKEFEYSISAGIVEDGLNTKYSRLAMNYGLSKRITLGGGMEYLSSLANTKNIPFISTSLRLSSNLLVSSQYDHGIRFKNILTYRLPANMQLELNYNLYKKGQQAINHNFLEERKVMLSMPLKAAGISFFSRMSFNQILLPGSKFSTAEWLVSGVIKGVSTTINTYALLNDFFTPYVYSNISMSVKLPAGFIFTPSAQYWYQKNDLISMRVGLEKLVMKHGFLNLNYEENFQSRFNNLSLGFRYDFSFAQTAFVTRKGNTGTSLLQSARGSLMYNQKSSFLGVNNRSSVGRGGMIISSFLDLNRNGIRDESEPKVSGLKIRLNGGRIESSVKDTTLRVFDLEPYVSYLLELDPNSLDNISWNLEKKILKVAINPNQLKLVEIPVSVIGEVSGTVFITDKESTKGLGRILVCIYNAKGVMVARTLTESDGYFNYLGLSSGKYTAALDSAQLHKLNMTAAPEKISFEIINTREGDVEDAIDFTLQGSIDIQAKPTLKVAKKPVIVPRKKVQKTFRKKPVKAKSGISPAKKLYPKGNIIPAKSPAKK
ncbi:hypothetical protein [Daejeonella oryzae]|uniref:hypothetical protein n=1 Tax=Daejeonella oryzae TaxID=1122943 RepID=UPI0004111142|nr:hypothetical protein [Daejeonella oryzae]